MNGYNVFKTYENGIKIRDFVISEIYLPIIWYGELGFTEFNVTMVTFLEGMFQRNRKIPVVDVHHCRFHVFNFLFFIFSFAFHCGLFLFSQFLGEIKKSKIVILRWPPFLNCDKITASYDGTIRVRRSSMVLKSPRL